MMARKLVAPDKEIILPAVRPNAARIQMISKLLRVELQLMRDSVLDAIKPLYEQADDARPEYAQDARPLNPATALLHLTQHMAKLSEHWLARIDKFAERTAADMVFGFASDNAAQWSTFLKQAGFTVPMKLSTEERALVTASTLESTRLIKSIGAGYLDRVQGVVLRGFTSGRDLAQISGDLRDSYGISARRAALIARDQANKTTAALNQSRQLQYGIKEAIWVHSHAGKEPRESHVKAGKEQLRYNVAQGAYLEDTKGVFRWLQPGEAINCRCTARSIIPGFND